MRVLIAGSNGYIGGALRDALVARGDEVFPVVRGAPENGQAGIDLDRRLLDVTHLPGGELAGIDLVYQLSGVPIVPRRWGPAKRRAIRESRIATTEVIARAMAATDDPPATLVAMSAVGYYGDRGDELLDEGSTAGVGFLAELCREWEAATAPARERGIRVVNARTGIVIGPGGGALKAQLPMFRRGLGARLGSGRQYMSWISLADEVGALVHLGQAPEARGAYNCTAPQPVRNEEFTLTLAAALHRPAFLHAPRPLLVAAIGARFTDEFLLASQRCRSQRLESSGYRFSTPRLADAIGVALGARH